MARKVWLGNNSARTLTVGGKTVAIGDPEKDRAVTIDAKTQAYLESRGHRFADPGSDEAKEGDSTPPNPGAGVPPIPASAGTSGEGAPAPETARARRQ